MTQHFFQLCIGHQPVEFEEEINPRGRGRHHTRVGRQLIVTAPEQVVVLVLVTQPLDAERAELSLEPLERFPVG